MTVFIGLIIFSVGVWACSIVDERERQSLKKEIDSKDVTIGLLKEENKGLIESNNKLKEAITRL